MTHARVGASAVLDAAQLVIDKHRTTIEHFGRCMNCGKAWPCEERTRAANSFTEAGRLPRRKPVQPGRQHISWSAVDWFGRGHVTTAARGERVAPPWKLRVSVP